MKKSNFLIGFVFILCFGALFSVKCQVSVSQEFIDSATKAFNLVVEQREAIEKFKTERAKTDIERASADVLIKGLNDLIAIKDKTIAQYEMLSQFQQQIIKFQQEIIEKLQAMLKKPKSVFQKFLGGLMEVLKAAVFILVGKGLAGL